MAKASTPKNALTPRRTPIRVIRASIGFIVMSVVAGVLATVGATPVIALTGLATTNSISLFQNLPSYLEIGSLMQRTNIYAGDQANPTLLASFYDQNRVEVPFDQIAQSVKDAAVAGEDPRFYEHGGVDLQGTLRAIASTYVLGSDTQGGSSITQQYVKNVLVQKAESISDETERNAAYEEATETTPERKVKEMRLAIGLEKQYSKDEILLGYLNIALFGGTVYGIEAAANYYYGISASQLTVAQSASLMAIVNNPEKFRFDQPDDPDNGAANGYAATLERRNYILNQMHKYGKITDEQTAEAAATPISPNITQPSTGCQTAGNAAYFCDYVTYQLRNDPAFGATDDDRYANIRRGGYDIYTTLDLSAQAEAQSALDAQVPQTDSRFDVGAAASAVQGGTGRVLAMVQNKTYSQDETVLNSGDQYTAINYNTDFDEGGSTGFQTGSTYKVFTLADWLTAGHTLTEQFDSRRQNWTGFADSCNGTQNYTSPVFNPQNDSSSEDANTMNALTATTNSINTGFIGMAHKLDLCEIRKTAEAFGIHRADGDPLEQGAAAVLGTNEVAPLTVAAAYAGIANDGVTCSPIAIDRIVDSSGADVAPPASTCTTSVTPEVSHAMQYAMKTVITNGTATASNPNDGIEHIAKTGTTDGNADVWTAGASSNVGLAVWVGSVNGYGDGTKMNLRTINFSSGPAATSRHRIWKPIMTELDSIYGGDAFTAPAASALATAQVTVPNVVGATTATATATLTAAGFTVGSTTTVDSALPAGQVVSTSPAAGASAPRGSSISLSVSSGTAPAGAPGTGAPGTGATPAPVPTVTTQPGTTQ